MRAFGREHCALTLETYAWEIFKRSSRRRMMGERFRPSSRWPCGRSNSWKETPVFAQRPPEHLSLGTELWYYCRKIRRGKNFPWDYK